MCAYLQKIMVDLQQIFLGFNDTDWTKKDDVDLSKKMASLTLGSFACSLHPGALGHALCIDSLLDEATSPEMCDQWTAGSRWASREVLEDRIQLFIW